MGLLDRLKSGQSTLGLNGEQPPINTVAGENGVATLLSRSELDLNGQTPTKYSDTAPESQGGKV